MRSRLVLLAASLLLLSACGATPEGTASTSEAPMSNESAEQCSAVVGGVPRSAKDFECLNLSSVSGRDASGELAWLGEDPFTLVTMPRDGAVAFASKTPCNTLMSQVDVTDSQFVVNANLGMTQMACQSPQSDREQWVIKFFSTPLDYTLNTDSLTLSNSVGTVIFKPAGS